MKKWRSLKLNPRERLMLVGVILSLLLGIYYVSYQRQQIKIDALTKTLQAEKQNLEKKIAEYKELESKSLEALKTVSAAESHARYLEASRYLSNLLKKLGASEQPKDFNLKQILVKDHQRVNNMQRSAFQLEVETSFLTLGRFLESLAKADVLIEVRSLNMNRIDNDLKRCHATIEVMGYYNGDSGS